MKTNNFKLNKYTGVLLCSVLMFFACSKKDAPAKPNMEKAELTSPAIQAQGIEIEDANLKWKSVKDPNGGAVVYDIYLDTDNSPTIKLVGDWETTTYRITTKLDYGVTYYWRVIAKDGKGGESESNLGVFTTREKTAQEMIIGKWFLSEMIVDGIPDPLDNCQKKGNFQFFIDGSLTVVGYGNNPCTVISNRTLTYRLPNETTLVFPYGTSEEKNSILSLTPTELKLSSENGIQMTLVREP